MIELRPVADGVFVARTQPLDVNVTVVLGDDGALVIDTLSTEAQARALLDAIRSVTLLPLTVAVTHFHFDHCFGAAVLAEGGRPIWGHPYVATELTERGRHWQSRWYDEWASDAARAGGGTRGRHRCNTGPPGTGLRDDRSRRPERHPDASGSRSYRR